MNDHFGKRQNLYQKHQEVDLVKKSSEKFLISLRKSKRNEIIKQLRSTSLNEEALNIAFYLELPSDNLSSFFPELQNAKTEIEKLKIYIEILRYPQIPENLIYEILIILTNSLHIANPEINPRPYFIRFGIMDILISYIKDHEDLDIIKQSIWCLSNIIAGPENYSNQVQSADIIPKLMQLMSLDNIDILSNICHLLANLILDNPSFCTQIIDLRFLSIINDLEFSNKELSSSVAFCLSSLCHNNSLLSICNSACILKIYERLIDFQYLSVLYGLANLTKSNINNLNLVMDSKTLQSKIFNSLKMNSKIAGQGILILGNFALGNSDHEEFLINNNCVDLFYEILKNQPEENIKAIYWVLCNLSQGCNKIQLLTTTHKITLEFEFALGHFSEIIRVEASFFYLFVTRNTCIEMKMKLVDSGIFFALAPNLDSGNVELVENCLRIADSLISIQKFLNCDVALVFKESGCLEKVEKLVFAKSEKVEKAASQIINTYFV